MHNRTDSTSSCASHTWCIEDRPHDLDGHAGHPLAVSASADPETFDYDLGNGVVRVPMVMTLLAAPVGQEPRVALRVSRPGVEHVEVSVYLTVREAARLRDQLADLVEEALR